MSHPSRTINQLLKHCRTITRTGPFATGRMSRGEYWISYLILAALSNLISTILRQAAGDIGSIIASIIGIVFSIFQIKLIIKRSHDINESGWYSFIPVFVMVAIGALSLIILPRVVDTQNIFTDGDAFQGFLTAWPSILSGVLLIATSLWFIWRSCKLVFRAGKKEANKYGTDPLQHQPTSNKRYRVVGTAIMLLSMIISVFAQPTINNNYNTTNSTTTDSAQNITVPQS